MRELENLLERALALCESDIINALDLGLRKAQDTGVGSSANLSTGGQPRGAPISSTPAKAPIEHAPAPVADAGARIDLDGPLDEVLEAVERRTILRALEQVRWNKTRAAKRLGISFGALRYRMQKLDLD